MKCDQCQVERAGRSADALPRQWKRFGERVLCHKCKRESLRNLVISMPVIEAVGISKDEFYAAFRAAARDAQVASNIAMREFAKLEPTFVPGPDVKLPKWQSNKSVYHTCRAVVPAMDTNSLASLLNRLQSTYSRRRFEMLVTGKASLPQFAKLQPVPIKGGSWTAGFDAENRPIVSVRLGSTDADGLRGARITLRLAGGAEYRRQLADFRRIANGEATPADMKLCPDYRDGKLIGVMARMTLTKPAASVASDRTGEMLVTMGGADLLAWDGMPPIHLDRANNLVNGWAARRQRIADDMKHERRWPARERAGVVVRLGSLSSKYQNAINTLVKQLAAHVAGAARRKGVRTVVVSQLPSTLTAFPWSGLLLAIRQRLEMDGIECREQAATANV